LLTRNVANDVGLNTRPRRLNKARRHVPEGLPGASLWTRALATAAPKIGHHIDLGEQILMGTISVVVERQAVACAVQSLDNVATAAVVDGELVDKVRLGDSEH